MDWFSVVLLLSVIASCLVLSLRAITSETNPFLFMMIVTGGASICIFSYMDFNEISVAVDDFVMGGAFLAGLSVAVLDVCFIFMFRYGAPVSLAIPIFRVLSIMIAFSIGIAFYDEKVSVYDVLGICLACVAIYLLNVKPKVKTRIRKS